jgi:hypothetical protein
VELNLDLLKHEVLKYLEDEGFAVFHSSPGGLDRQQMVLWNSETYPDYRMFIDVARKAGGKIVLFATDQLESSDLDDLKSQIEECDLSRDDRRELESRLRAFRKYEGATCTLEIGFDHEGRLYVFDVQPDWYDEFVELEDEIVEHLTDDDDLDDEPLGGYYSKN